MVKKKLKGKKVTMTLQKYNIFLKSATATTSKCC